ncbi:MAG: cadmium-translocating P-type ATPase, partial [Proteobacteria bacterium]|nr:cadmium-translocating P-type ATPase [Pseudomonadota bacterium]
MTTSSCDGSCHCQGPAPEPNSAVAPGLTSTRFAVPDLCCESEAAVLRRQFGRITGVDNISIDFVSREVIVHHDEDQCTAEDLKSHLGSTIATPSNQPPTATPVPKALIVAACFFVLAIPGHWVPLLAWAALPAVAIAIPPILKKALVALQNRVLDMNTLMTIAIVGALAIGEWTEGAAIVVLFGISEWLEQRALDRANKAMVEVMSLVPQRATLAAGGSVPVEEVTVGTVVVVSAGEQIPIDGDVVQGGSSVDESMLTGESIPIEKQIGSPVFSGTLNQGGYLEIKTTATSGESAMARLARLVTEARATRSPMERFVDRFAKIYTPAVVFAAAAIIAIPILLGADPQTWIYRGLVMMVVACPCSLVISTPVAVVSALARGARSGVLIKGGEYLEALGQLTTIAFDKTGTLTEGRFKVVDCLPLEGHTEHSLHQWLAIAESGSTHPLAAALVDHAGIDTHTRPQTYQTVEGEGITVEAEGHTIHVGNHRMAERLGWHNAREHEHLEKWMAAGRTVVFLGVDGELVGLHSLADLPRPEAAPAIAVLKKMGIE